MVTRLIMYLILCSSLAADVKVMTTDGKVETGYKVEYGAGNILLYPKENSDFKHRISLQKVTAVVQKETSSSGFIKDAFLKGKFAAVASDKGLQLAKKNFHTGWGKKSYFYLTMSYIKVKKFEEASKVLKQGRAQIAGEEDKEDRLLLEIAENYLNFSKNEKHYKMTSFKTMNVPESSLGKMYYYQLEGILLEKQSKSSLAVLAYYKGIFLGVKSREREQVLARVEEIYKKQGDPRKLPDLNKL